MTVHISPFGTAERRTTTRNLTIDQSIPATKEWSFSELLGDSLLFHEVASGRQVGGELHELFDFGFASRDNDIIFPDGSTLPPDGIATGQIASTANDITYWVGVDAPVGLPVLLHAIGSQADLRETQVFVKRDANATLSFTITAALMNTSDRNGTSLRFRPEIHEDGRTCDLVGAEIGLTVNAFTIPPPPDIEPFDVFFSLSGSARLYGLAGDWVTTAETAGSSHRPLWDPADFDEVHETIEGEVDAGAVFTLVEPLTFTIDLSTIEVDQSFIVQSTAVALAYNRIAGPPQEFGSSASAFLRDPQVPDAVTFTFTGLEPVPTAVPELPPPTPGNQCRAPNRTRRPGSCSSAPRPTRRRRLPSRRSSPSPAPTAPRER